MNVMLYREVEEISHDPTTRKSVSHGLSPSSMRVQAIKHYALLLCSIKETGYLPIWLSGKEKGFAYDRSPPSKQGSF
jgi:hypothetical protein